MRKLITLMAALFIAIFANAQVLTEEVSITSDPENNYYSGDKAFENAAIASALGLENAAELQALIQDGDNVYIQLADSASNKYTGNHNEYWMNINGIPQGYGDEGTCWYVGLSYDVEEGADVSTGVVDIYMGQMPDFFRSIYEPSTLKATILLVNGEKSVQFNVTLNVNAAEFVDLPEPVTTLANLNIIGSVTAEVEQYVRPNYDSDKITVSVAGIAEQFGVAGSVIAKNIDKFVFAKSYDEVQETINPELTNAFTAGAPGWWYVAAFDSESGTEGDELVSGAYANGLFYMEAISYDAETEEVSFNLGQYPGKMTDGATKSAKFYLVCGNKAFEITAKLSTTNPPTSDFTEMVQMGESTVEYNALPDNSYTYGIVTVDLEAVAQAMGCAVGDLALKALADESSLSTNSTANNGGYWMTKTDGYVCAWGAEDCGFFIEPETSTEIGTLHFGQYPNAYASEIGKTFSYKLYYTFGSSYYVVNVNFTVKEEKKSDVYTCVAKTILEKQLVPTTEGVYPNGTTAIDIDFIASKIGTTDFTLYTDKAKTEDEVTTLEFNKNYTCDPKPGFWYGTTTYENAEHQMVVDNAGWGTNSFGVTYADGTLSWFTYPDQRKVGDEYLAHLYFVNDENGNYVDMTLVISYVSEIDENNVTTVAQSDLAYGVTAEDLANSTAYIDLDIASIMEALGLESEDEIEAAEQTVQATSVTYKTASLGDAFCFDAQGNLVSDDDENLEIMSYLTTTDEDGEALDHLKLFVAFIGETLDFTNIETSISYKVGIVYNGKRMMFNVTLANPESELVGIKNATASNASAIYTVAGTKASSLQKGINIVVENGKAKKILK